MTKITEKLQKKRQSISVQEFKKNFELFLKETNADKVIADHLRKDLSAKIDMPYYGEIKMRRTMKPMDICLGFCKLGMIYEDKEFVKAALGWLCRQQGQSFRKICPQNKKRGSRYKGIASSGKIIWEHPIPVNHTKKYIFECILKKDIGEINNYLTYISNIQQVSLLKQEDEKILKKYKDAMPLEWNYRTDSPYIRYILSGMDLNKIGIFFKN